GRGAFHPLVGEGGGTMAKTVADLLVERLLDWGVKTVFAHPGDGINGIFEAWRQNQDRLQYVQVRHEEAAAFAACGYAKFTGNLGVCMATSGPAASTCSTACTTPAATAR